MPLPRWKKQNLRLRKDGEGKCEDFIQGFRGGAFAEGEYSDAK